MAKTVLITGASRGIGAAIARRLTAEGWQVAVNYCCSREKAERLAAELGNGSFAVGADISRPEEAEAMVKAAQERLSHLDALVCNAGIALPGGLLQDCSCEDWRRVFDVNVDGMFYTVRAALPAMIRRQTGRIVTVSSMWGQVGGSCEVPYSASKGAVLAFTKALAQEVAPSGITVNAVAPGVIMTDMMSFASDETLDALREETPLGRLGAPEDVAEAVAFLLNDRAGFITGQILGVNGGMVIV